MNIVKLLQGSAEWHEHRRSHRNASETPTVLGVSPWQTPYQLWQIKLGLLEPEVTPAMLHGTQLEPAARAAYEALTGLVMQPLVLVDGEYSASLDGLTLAGDRVLEIKCPVRGRESTLWQQVAAGQLPEHYQWQVEHQLMVAGAEVADVFVFDGTEGIRLEVAPDPSTWPRIRSAWADFMGHVASKDPPLLAKGDTRERDDPEWAAAAQAFIQAKANAETMQKALDDAKAQLIALTTHTSQAGGGVTVARYWKKGNIDYKRIPAFADVDLETFRGDAREETRISLSV
jgi:putative phage-type endonuclease